MNGLDEERMGGGEVCAHICRRRRSGTYVIIIPFTLSGGGK